MLGSGCYVALPRVLRRRSPVGFCAAPSAAATVVELNREAGALAQQLEATRVRLDNEQLEGWRQADELNVQVLQTKLQLCFEAMARTQGAPGLLARLELRRICSAAPLLWP